MTPELIAQYADVEGVPGDIRARLRSAETLYSAEEVEFAVDQLAVRLTVALQDRNPVLVPVLHGGLVFAGMLLRRLVFPLRQAYVHVGRYTDTQGGELSRYHHGGPDLKGETVVVVDDILDEGVTLTHLVDWALDEGASEVVTVVLLTKNNPRRPGGLQADHSALFCPDRFVVGCGLDIDGYGRNLPGLFALGEALGEQ